MDEGWPYKMIREWLFGQTASEGIPALELKAGDSYSVVWSRTAKSAEHAGDACEQALSNWYCKRYAEWVKERKELERTTRFGWWNGWRRLAGRSGRRWWRDERGRESGIRSLLFEAISNAHEGQSDPKEIARLAQAWARVSDAGVEVEKMNLRKQGGDRVGLDALYEEVQAVAGSDRGVAEIL